MSDAPGFERLYTAEITVYDATIPGEKTLYYSTGQGLATLATDTPASSVFEPRIIQPALLQRDVFDEGTTQGNSRVGYGDLILNNLDGALDGFLAYGFDGRKIVIRSGFAGAAYPAGYDTVLVGTMEQPDVALDLVTISLRDLQIQMQVPLQPTKFAGTNALPAGLEGVAGDLQGKPKPICLGQVFNVSVPCVNTSKLIYQLHDAALASVDGVYDKAVPLVAGATYATTTALLDDAQAPALGQYKAYLGGGGGGAFIRLGGTPAGVITTDLSEGANAAARTAGQLFARVLARAGKISGDWSASDVTALDTANSAVLGVWVQDESTFFALLGRIAGSVGAWWGVDRLGVFRIKQFAVPSGSPVITLTVDDLAAPLQRQLSNDPTRGIPVYSCIVHYAQNYTIQETDFDNVTYASSAPSSPLVNDLWIDTSVVPNVWNRWNGSTWIRATTTSPDIDVLQTQNAPIQAAATGDGFQILSNPDFANGLTGYTVYDNNATGNVVHSIVTDSAAPNSSGKKLQIVTSAGAAPNPGLGGFFRGIGPDSGAFAQDTYHRGSTIIWRIRAKIPVGYTINFASNAIGTTPVQQWLTPVAGTGNWFDYLFKLIPDVVGSFSSTGFFYLATGVAPVTWFVAVCSAMCVTHPAGVAIQDVDANRKALVDFASSHTNKTVDNVADGSTYARTKGTELASGQVKQLIDTAESLTLSSNQVRREAIMFGQVL